MHPASLTVVALALAAATSARAGVDQANDGPYFGGFTISASPIGQGFTPTLDKLDFVELLINDQNPGFGGAVDIAVRIRSTDIAGQILGTSDAISFADQLPQPFQLPEVVRLSFASPVALTPGASYVIEPFKLGGISDLGVFGTGYGVDAYAGGVSYFQGAVFAGPDAPFDLWFREGVNPVPEPATWAVMLLGLLGLVARRRCAAHSDQRFSGAACSAGPVYAPLP